MDDARQPGANPIVSLATISEIIRFLPVAGPLKGVPFEPFIAAYVLPILKSADPTKALEKALPKTLFTPPASYTKAALHEFSALPSKLLKSSRVVDMATLLLGHIDTTFANALHEHNVAIWTLDTETIHVAEVEVARS